MAFRILRNRLQDGFTSNPNLLSPMTILLSNGTRLHAYTAYHAPRYGIVYMNRVDESDVKLPLPFSSRISLDSEHARFYVSVPAESVVEVRMSGAEFCR